ncbi:MAG: response regulator [Candidatus Competibacteraceae bacterium]|nr:response regulator [Candidatus Competibacteraceae bacterium]
MAQTQRCIMLVDDEQNVLNALKRELTEWADRKELEVLTATSAPLALKVLVERGRDTAIVVSDLRMPEMKGSDFLLEVRAAYPDIVTILLTGYSETEEVVKAVRAGIFSYMLKPWDSDYLLAEIEKAYDHGELRRQNARYLKIIEEELKWAGEMQRALLRPTLPRSEGVEFRSSYRPVPSLYCGGDYYDVISLSTDRYLVLIRRCRGPRSARGPRYRNSEAVIYPEYVRAALVKEFSPGGFLTWLNQRLNFELRQTAGLIVTFFAGVLDLKSKTFKYANAGHCRPYIQRGGAAFELPISGSSLGFAKSVMYPEQVVPILEGDVLTFFTDGLVEICQHLGSGALHAGELFGAVEYGSDYHKRIMRSPSTAPAVRNSRTT